MFILPPTMPELERRLRGRAQDPDDIVRFRLAQVASDVTHWPEYDYVLVNKEFEASVAAVRAILAAERLRRKRQPGLTEFVEQFRACRGVGVGVAFEPVGAAPSAGQPATSPRSCVLDLLNSARQPCHHADDRALARLPLLLLQSRAE